MSSLINIGLSSLLASKSALMVTNENIANADNPFFSRRVIDFQELNDNGFGNGVQVSDVRRVADNIINKNLVISNSLYAAADMYAQSLKAFEPQLDTGTNSVATYIQQSLNQLNNLNASASSIQGRNAYLYQLNALSDRFNQLGQQISTEKQNVRQMMLTNTNELNLLIQQVAQLNVQIAGAPLDAPASMMLLDERDRLMNSMAEYINFDSYTDDRGMVNITLMNGISLVFGETPATMAAVPGKDDPQFFDLVLTNQSPPEIITSFISGGKFAGLLSFYQNGLDAAEYGLNRLALSISDKFNAQNKLGMDLTGNLGQALFSDINAPNLVAQRTIALPNNTGTGNFTVSINDTSQLGITEYHVLFDSATHYTVVRDSDNQVVGSNDVPNGLTIDGFTLTIANTNFQTGDGFVISPLNGAAKAMDVVITDPRQLALAFPVAVNTSMNNLGAGAIHVDSITDTTNAAFTTSGQLSPPITVQFISPTTFNLINAQTGVQIGATVTYNPLTGASVFPMVDGYDPGYRVSLSGDMSTGDQFSIDYNHAMFDDNRNGLFLAGLYQQGQLDGGRVTFTDAYHALSGDISSKTNVANIMFSTQEIVKSQAELRRDQVSGVSLEEEVGNLARYEQSYQASARILETLTTMFDVLINLGRR